MNKKILVTLAMLGMAFTPLAHGALAVSGSVGGAPTGVFKVNFNDLPLGSAGGTASTPTGSVDVSFSPDGGVVQGEVFNSSAAPVLSGGNGTGFRDDGGNQDNGENGTKYLITGTPGSGSATLDFNSPQTYFGILWGSVDASNTLTFYNAANQVVGVVTGADVLASPNGNQGVNGTVYVNITSDTAFVRVVATSGVRTFEFDNVAYNPTIPSSGCVRTQGYWKNHEEEWGDVMSLSLGNVSYTKQQLLDIFGTPVRGNGLISLAHQLIAAKLNIAAGASVPQAVEDAILAADALIGSKVIPPVGSDKVATKTTSATAGILDDYNNGRSSGGPEHCE